VKPPNSKVVALCKDYKFVREIMDWFGLVSEIQCPEVRLPKTKTEFQSTPPTETGFSKHPIS
jgi:hypothetical protein